MSEQLRILIVEDRAEDAALTERELRKGGVPFTSLRVETRADFLRALSEFTPEIILSDYNLPQFNGLEALRLLKESGLEVPFILITGSMTEEVAVDCMKRGVTDYILKTSLRRLPSAVANAMERVRAERARAAALEALRESEERYRVFVANSSEGIWRFELEEPLDVTLPADEQVEHIYRHSYLAECNDAMAQMYGYASAEEIVGLRGDQLLPRSNPLNVEYLRAFIHNGYRLVEAETVEVDRGGSEKYFLNNQAGVVQGGLLLRVWGTQRDVTERKLAERELDRQRAFLRQVIDTVPYFISVKDRGGRFTIVNRALAENYGTTVGGLTGRRDADFNPREEEVARIRRDDLEVLETGREKFIPEEVVTTFAGHQRYLQTIKRPLASDGGSVEQVLGVSTDITARKRAEENLRAADRRAVEEYERLLTRLADFALSLSTARELTTVYRALRDFTIASAPCTALCITLYHPERQEREAAYLWVDGEEMPLPGLQPFPVRDGPAGRAIKTGEVVLLDDYRKVMEHRPVVWLGAGSADAPRPAAIAPMAFMGRVIGTVEIQNCEGKPYAVEHVTAMRMAASLTAGAVENVRLLEQEREKEEQLRQSQKMEAVGQLAGGVAHDFNNLLTVITGYSDLLLRSVRGDESLSAKVEEIKRAGDRAAALTHQLLAFSRRQVMQPRVLDLNDVLADMERMLRRLIGEDIDLKTVPDPALWPVQADFGQIQQVVMNLAVNARDAMPGGGELTIETSNLHLEEGHAGHLRPVKPGRYVVLSVADTGTGMDAETQRRVFEPFFTTKEVGKGTGLGLSTVYGIVKQSDGYIELQSEPGAGTTFKVYLPMAEGAAESSQGETPRGAPERGAEMLLLVEDEEAVRRYAREVLEAGGYRLLVAGDGEEALRVAAAHEGPIHLLVTDVVMPRAGGVTLAGQLAGLRPETRVLYMSGYTDDALAHRGVLSPEVAFLEKPFTPDSLLRKVREVLDAREGADRLVA